LVSSVCHPEEGAADAQEDDPNDEGDLNYGGKDDHVRLLSAMRAI
jgi:hypothetical protein